MGFWVALQFLTIFPVPRRFIAKMEHVGESVVYFPIIGLIIGIILALLSIALSYVFPRQIVSVLLVIALAVLTGAHHIDGVADTFDGIIAGKSKAERMTIMSDTKIGTFGITAIALVLLFKYSTLVVTGGIQPLILMTVLSRWSMVSILFMFNSAKKSGMGFAYKQGATWQRFLMATIITLLIAIVLSGWNGLILIMLIWLLSFGIGKWVQSRIDGITGDTCGALNEINEAMTLLFIVCISTIERLYFG
ncbi:MAG TPA: adenosylcobinamide-GDP ribazoletransferase [Dehalococcoidia bacterium]|nr:adenosylcobinamide-GDP ribazoletransferase [Dehalococcoidia bacterium]